MQQDHGHFGSCEIENALVVNQTLTDMISSLLKPTSRDWFRGKGGIALSASAIKLLHSEAGLSRLFVECAYTGDHWNKWCNGCFVTRRDDGSELFGT